MTSNATHAPAVMKKPYPIPKAPHVKVALEELQGRGLPEIAGHFQTHYNATRALVKKHFSPIPKAPHVKVALEELQGRGLPEIAGHFQTHYNATRALVKKHFSPIPKAPHVKVALEELQGRGLPGIAGHFQTHCQSAEFSDSLSILGFEFEEASTCCFHANENLIPENVCYSKFHTALFSSKKRDDNLTGAQLSMCFHGTSPCNVDSILRNGLDPALRKNQSFGRGEYFSTDPSVALQYCKGGKELLVFVVLLLPESDNDKRVDTMERQRRHYRKNGRIVVVEKNHYQLPIGTVTFPHHPPGERLAKYKICKKRAVVAYLQKEVERIRNLVLIQNTKVKIMQQLIDNRVDIASEIYHKHCDKLDEDSKREIAWYAHRAVDEQVVGIYFVDLPSPVRTAAAATLSTACLQDQHKHAKKVVEEALEDLACFEAFYEMNFGKQNAKLDFTFGWQNDAKLDFTGNNVDPKHGKLPSFGQKITATAGASDSNNAHTSSGQYGMDNFNNMGGTERGNGGGSSNWQSNKVTPHRTDMIQHIVKLLKKDKGGSLYPIMKLVQIAKQLEVSLCRNAHSFEAYMDMTTLKQRLQQITASMDDLFFPTNNSTLFSIKKRKRSWLPLDSSIIPDRKRQRVS